MENFLFALSLCCCCWQAILFPYFSQTQKIFVFSSKNIQNGTVAYSFCYLLITTSGKSHLGLFRFSFIAFSNNMQFFVSDWGTRKEICKLKFTNEVTFDPRNFLTIFFFLSLQVVHLWNLAHIQKLKQLLQAYTVVKLCQWVFKTFFMIFLCRNASWKKTS